MESQTPQGMEERPQGAPQQGPQPGYTQPYGGPTTDELIQRSYPRARIGPGIFSRTDKIVMMIAFGVFLMFLGAIIIAVVTTSGGPNQWDEDYDEDDNGYIDGNNVDDYYEDLRAYDGARDAGVLLGTIVVNFGMLVAVLALFGGGIINNELDKFIRLAMIIAAGLIVAWSGLMVGWFAGL